MSRLLVIAFVWALGQPCVWAEPPEEQVSQTATDLEAKGDNLRREQNFGEAIKCYRRAMRAGGNEAALYNKIGMADLRLQLYPAAQEAFEQAYKRNPNDSNILNNLGVASHLRHRYQKAVKWYKKALALNEAEPAFHYNLGGSWFALGRFDRANAEYARALELDPNAFSNLEEQGIAGQSSAADRARLCYLMAKLSASRGDAVRALALLQKAKDLGYAGLENVYRDKEFSGLWKDARLTQVVRGGRR